MTQTDITPHYTLNEDEKAVRVMAYTQSNMFWGEVVVKGIIRVSTWLRTNSAPDRLTMYNVKVLATTVNNPPKPIELGEVNIAVSQLLAFHMAPPARDPVDYDETEPNRIMEPVALLFSTFRIDGNLRLSSRSSMSKFLEVTRENFTGIYDAKITNTIIPVMGTISVPFLLVRQESAFFTHP